MSDGVRSWIEIGWVCLTLFAAVIMVRVLRAVWYDLRAQQVPRAPILWMVAIGNWRRMLALAGLVLVFLGLGLVPLAPLLLGRLGTALIFYGLLTAGLILIVLMVVGEDRHRVRLERLVDPDLFDERIHGMTSKPWWTSTTIQMNLIVVLIAFVTALLAALADDGTITLAALLGALLAGANVYLRTLTSAPVTGAGSPVLAGQTFAGDPAAVGTRSLDLGESTDLGSDSRKVTWVLDDVLDVPIPIARRLLGLDLDPRMTEPDAARHAWRIATFGKLLGRIYFDFGPGVGVHPVWVCEGIALAELPQFDGVYAVQKVFLRLAPAVLGQLTQGSAKH